MLISNPETPAPRGLPGFLLMRHFVFSILVLIGLTACSFHRLPFVHKIDIQQGNVITQDMVARLQPQMDKKKVLFIMGTPLIQDTFNDDRWDYLYTYEHGGGDTERRRITLVFADEKLDHIEGDVQAASGPLVAELHHDLTVRVPGLKKRSLMTRVKDKIPFVEPDPEVVEVIDPTKETEPKQRESEYTDKELAEIFAYDKPPESSPYADIQAAPGEGIIVPPDAPTAEKKKGLISRFFDSIGLGADDDDDAKEGDFDPGDPRYRDITNQDDV